VRAIKNKLAAKAKAANTGFAAIGVSLDWSPEAGADYLLRGKSIFGTHDFGAWDEIHAGRNWMNELVIRYIWRDYPGTPGISQLVVVERTVVQGQRGLAVGADKLLYRALGPEAMIAWLNAGLPLVESALVK
jgi:hypothetical protein